MRIYIAGKITGDDNYHAKFADAEKQLTTLGHEPINPAAMRLPKSCKWEDYMRVCICLLELSDAICLLPDWRDSPGACIELGYATALKKNVLTAKHLLKDQDQESNAAEKKKNYLTERTCVVCGKKFVAGPASKFCSPECRKQSKTTQAAVGKAGPGGECAMNDCKYKAKAGGLNFCDYLGMTGQARGCEVEGCTKYEKK